MDRFSTGAARLIGLALAVSTIVLTTSIGQAHAARLVDYEGEVADADHTPFVLSAEYRDRAPWGLVSFQSGRILLTCDVGTHRKRIHIHLPPEYRRIRHRDGYFSWRIGYVLVETGEFIFKGRVWGNIGTHSASGTLWIKTFGDEENGDCRSEQLSWTVERIPGQFGSSRHRTHSPSHPVRKPQDVRDFSADGILTKLTRR
jgi:hypothetical protein